MKNLFMAIGCFWLWNAHAGSPSPYPAGNFCLSMLNTQSTTLPYQQKDLFYKDWESGKLDPRLLPVESKRAVITKAILPHLYRNPFLQKEEAFFAYVDEISQRRPFSELSRTQVMFELLGWTTFHTGDLNQRLNAILRRHNLYQDLEPKLVRETDAKVAVPRTPLITFNRLDYNQLSGVVLREGGREYSYETEHWDTYDYRPPWNEFYTGNPIPESHIVTMKTGRRAHLVVRDEKGSIEQRIEVPRDEIYRQLGPGTWDIHAVKFAKGSNRDYLVGAGGTFTGFRVWTRPHGTTTWKLIGVHTPELDTTNNYGTEYDIHDERSAFNGIDIIYFYESPNGNLMSVAYGYQGEYYNPRVRVFQYDE